MSTIRIGSTVFATNLFWQLTAGAAASAAAARRQAADLPPDLGPFRFIVIRRTTPRQFGVSSHPAPEHRAGMPSAAAMLADRIDGNWAGLFEVAEGWYFLECRRGFIHPDSDRLFSRNQRDEACGALEAAREERRIGLLYAPAELGLSGTIERPIEPVLARATRGLSRFAAARRLAPLDQKTAILRLASRSLPWLATAAAGVLVGPWAWDQAVSRLFPPPPSVQAMSLSAPWEDKPVASLLLRSCVPAVLGHPELPGTQMKSAECGQRRIVYRYRSYSAIAPALIQKEKAAPDCQLRSEGDALFVLDCARPPVRALGRLSLPAEDLATQRLWDAFGGIGAGVTVGTAVALPPSDPQNPQRGPFARAMNVNLKTVLPPDALVEPAAAVPAFTLITVSYAAPGNGAGQGSWSLEGTVYVR